MPGNLALRLGAAGQVFVSKNRRVSHPWRWGSVLVTALVLATMLVLFAGTFLAWTDFQFITQSYQISQAQETQKQLLDLNRKLRIEYSNLTAISRLEKLAAQFGMEAPQPTQVVNLP
ncbi:MAG: cell division protein FtsL [Deltaproteobacteria bacterium]|nr:cell division protein FtsL [Deltaproteobacteria bacterium]